MNAKLLLFPLLLANHSDPHQHNDENLSVIKWSDMLEYRYDDTRVLFKTHFDEPEPEVYSLVIIDEFGRTEIPNARITAR